MKTESLLTEGKIPPHTVCPFTKQCPSHNASCKHKGIEHTVPFSCGYARLFNLYRDEKQN